MNMDKTGLAELPLEELLSFAKAQAENRQEQERASGPEAVTVTEPELSFAQERLWFMDRLSPNNPFYNIPFCLEITGELDQNALSEAWRIVIERHHCLRSCYPGDKSGKPTVTLLPADNLPMHNKDISTQPMNEQKKILTAAMEYEGKTGFDMAEGPLMRGTLIKQQETLHTLLVTFHHIIFDGWSVAVFYKELFEIYDELRQGKGPRLKKVEATYEQYALWQRQRLTPQYLKQECQWWSKQLKDMPELELRTDTPRPETQSFAGDTIEFSVPLSVSQKMDTLAQKHNATPFMVWLTVFGLMLSRFSGQTDFAVGCAVAGRNHPSTEGIIGFFLNNLVIRNKLVENMPFVELLEQLRNTVLSSMEHEELPFQILTDAVNEERSLNKNPLYQAGFIYQNTPALESIGEGLTLRSVLVPMKTTHLDVELLIWPEQEGLRCYLVYASDIISARRANDMAETIQKISRIVSNTPDIPIHEILPHENESILHGQEQEHKFQPPWNRLKDQLEKDAAATALIVPGESGKREDSKNISYAALHETAMEMAARLEEHSIKPGSTISIMLHPGLQQTAAMLAVWRQGCAWVPLDPNHPASMNQWVIEDSGSCCVMTETVLWEEHSRKTGEIITPCLLDSPVKTKPSMAQKPAADSTACILYTSGSTGRPKGIALSHEAINTRLCWMWQELPWKTNDVACQKTSPCFVDFIWETFGAILGGTPLVLTGPNPARDINRLLTITREHGVTQMVLVPSLLRAMHEIGQGLNITFPCLRSILSSGEILSPELVRKTRQALPEIRIFNLYGSTEVMDATWHEASVQDTEAIPIGSPIHNTIVAVLDEAMRPVPIGEEGILYVCGPSVAHGYHGAAREKNNLFSTPEIPAMNVPSGRWFCMGDRISQGADGLLYYHGRKDRLLKVRGVRMEPEAIVNILEQHELVKEAIVTVLPGPESTNRLVAYLLLNTVDRKYSPPELAGELRPHMHDKLPAAMVPDMFIPVSEWPRTPSGKISTRELPKPETMFRSSEKIQTTPIQSEILNIWKSTLEIGGIGVRDNFFEVGGTSLLIVSVHEQLQRALKRKFPLTALFQNPTVESMASWLDNENKDAAMSRPTTRRTARQNTIQQQRKARTRFRS
ncbi:non-ribosomal peptide synthetase [Maridesulfovibrio sp.]|uniref:non-ribosomal peptide synthetase n=1 Tax=Maridesulfovibrio sp. TaxID=2795000 RepID=UPI003BAC238F